MKCPKCGYVSFEYLDECKKCGKSLHAFKSEHGFYGYQHKDLMVEEYLEEKSKTKEEAGIEETEEEDAITNVGEEDGSLENIVSKIKGATESTESAVESVEEISYDLKEDDTASDQTQEIVTDLGKPAEPTTEEKESSESDLSLDEIDFESTGGEAEEVTVETGESEESPAEKESSESDLSLDEIEFESIGEETEEVTVETGESEEPPAEKESVESELTLDEIEFEETEVQAPTEEKDLEDEITMGLEDLNTKLEIDDEITQEDLEPEKKDHKKKEKEEKF